MRQRVEFCEDAGEVCVRLGKKLSRFAWVLVGITALSMLSTSVRAADDDEFVLDEFPYDEDSGILLRGDSNIYSEDSAIHGYEEIDLDPERSPISVFGEPEEIIEEAKPEPPKSRSERLSREHGFGLLLRTNWWNELPSTVSPRGFSRDMEIQFLTRTKERAGLLKRKGKARAFVETLEWATDQIRSTHPDGKVREQLLQDFMDYIQFSGALSTDPRTFWSGEVLSPTEKIRIAVAIGKLERRGPALNRLHQHLLTTVWDRVGNDEKKQIISEWIRRAGGSSSSYRVQLHLLFSKLHEKSLLQHAKAELAALGKNSKSIRSRALSAALADTLVNHFEFTNSFSHRERALLDMLVLRSSSENPKALSRVLKKIMENPGGTKPALRWLDQAIARIEKTEGSLAAQNFAEQVKSGIASAKLKASNAKGAAEFLARLSRFEDGQRYLYSNERARTSLESVLNEHPQVEGEVQRRQGWQGAVRRVTGQVGGCDAALADFVKWRRPVFRAVEESNGRMQVGFAGATGLALLAGLTKYAVDERAKENAAHALRQKREDEANAKIIERPVTAASDTRTAKSDYDGVPKADKPSVQSTFFDDAVRRMNLIASKLKDKTNPDESKLAFEAELEAEFGRRIRYDMDRENPLEVFLHGEGQCRSLTLAYLLSLQKAQGNEGLKNRVVILEDGHMLAGFLEHQVDGKLHLVGQEMTLEGKARKDYGPISEVAKEEIPMRVVSAQDYLEVLSNGSADAPLTQRFANAHGISTENWEKAIQALPKKPETESDLKHGVKTSASPLAFGRPKYTPGSIPREKADTVPMKRQNSGAAPVLKQPSSHGKKAPEGKLPERKAPTPSLPSKVNRIQLPPHLVAAAMFNPNDLEGSKKQLIEAFKSKDANLSSLFDRVGGEDRENFRGLWTSPTPEEGYRVIHNKLKESKLPGHPGISRLSRVLFLAYLEANPKGELYLKYSDSPAVTATKLKAELEQETKPKDGSGPASDIFHGVKSLRPPPLRYPDSE